MLERLRFRLWWQPPRVAGDQPEERRVSYLELFYDLVYVVIIAQLSHTLAEEINLASIGDFIFLFIIVWWAWFNGAMYHDLHGNNDIRTRVFTFLQMFTVAAMAVFAHSAKGAGAVGFILSYAVFHLLLTWLWWRTGVHDPYHRPLSQPYALTFLLTSLLFILSIFVPPPWRFILWAAALLADLGILLLGMIRTDPAAQVELNRFNLISASGVERFKLFTIIVLDEVIVGVVGGVAGSPDLNWLVGGVAVLGMTIAIGLWWVYFDLVPNRSPIARPLTRLGWIYLHLLVAIGITAVGASVLNVVEHTGETLPGMVRWLLVGAVGTVLIAIALIIQTFPIPESYRVLYWRGFILMLIAGIAIVSLGMTQIGTIPLLLALVALLLAPIFYGILLWIKVFDAREIEI